MNGAAYSAEKPAPVTPAAAWKALALAAAVVFLHSHTLVLLTTRWYAEGDYSYCFFIPLVSLFLVWRQRDELRGVAPQPARTGFFLIAGAFLIQFAGIVANIAYLQGISLVLLLAGIALLLGGRSVLGRLAFPILYLILMVPLPGIVHDWISFPLQLLATQVSAAILEFLKIPVAHEGNVFQLAGATLQVAEACSGLRSLFGLVGMGLLLGYLITPRFWERVVLSVSAVPIAVVANVLRVAGTGIIYEYVGAKWGQGFYHGFSAWLVFVFALGVLFAESALISRLFPRQSGGLAGSGGATR